MKKSLIAVAIAALASPVAFAQNTTLTGNLDFAAGSIKTGSGAADYTVSTRDLVGSTSVITIRATEDLGGGMRATANVGLDPRWLANDSASGTATQPGLQRDEIWVGIEGGFGNIRLGSPNSVGLTTYLTAAPLGTGIGSGYGTLVQDYSAIRYNRSARYDSPVINGFRVSALYAPGSENLVLTAPAGVPLSINQAREVTELGISYTSGPLTIAYANVAQSASAQPTAGIVKTSADMIAASYALGKTTLSAGWNNGDRLISTTAAVQTEGYRLGIAQAMGAITLRASFGSQESGTVNEKVTGLRADYALSKRTTVYSGYEKYESDTTYVAATATSAATGGDRVVFSIGLRHSF